VVPGSARIADGTGIATVQLSRRDDVAGIVQDIRDGVIRNVSVGYRYHKVEKTEKDDGSVPLWRVVDWEPFELSAVSVPADPGAQVRSESGRKLEQFPCIVSRHMPAGSLRVPGHVAIRRMRMRMLALEFGLAA
jgi:phage head maturation protease